MKGFIIEISTGPQPLSIDELWPDKDGPDNPTVFDVRALIAECGGPLTVMSDWALDMDIRVDVREES